MISQVRVWLTIGGLTLCAAAGCGKKTGPATIHGDVRFDGAPLAQGSILFEPLDGTLGLPAGGEIKDGHYELTADKRVCLGLNSVKITSQRPSGKMVQDPFGPKGSKREMYVEAVAPRYNAKSTLTQEIKPGDNVRNFDVQSK